MKLRQVLDLEKEVIEALRVRALNEKDNEAAMVLLDHLRQRGNDIGQWKTNKDKLEKEHANKNRRSSSTTGNNTKEIWRDNS